MSVICLCIYGGWAPSVPLSHRVTCKGPQSDAYTGQSRRAEMVFICFEQYKLSFLTTGIKNAKTKFESNNYLSSSELLKL